MMVFIGIIIALVIVCILLALAFCLRRLWQYVTIQQNEIEKLSNIIEVQQKGINLLFDVYESSAEASGYVEDIQTLKEEQKHNEQSNEHN